MPRTVTSRRPEGTSPIHSAADAPHVAACTVLSGIWLRLSPPVVPMVEIHTSRYDVGVEESAEILLAPACSALAGASTVVSASRAGLAVEAERSSTRVPVLETLMPTLPITVGLGSCNSSPTPFLKFGKGTGSE